MLLTDGSMVHRTNGNGNAYGMRLAMRYNSYPMLEGLKYATKSTHNIFFDMFDNQSGKRYPVCILQLSSTKLADKACALFSFDSKRKSYDVKLPADIHAMYYPSLLRGIFDGDGCWGFCTDPSKKLANIQLKLTSANKAFLYSVQDVINTQCFKTNSSFGSVLT